MQKHPKPVQINSSGGIRPYAQDKGGYVQKMRRATDRAMEYMMREYKQFMAHSEFKKPYASPTYDDMEYGYKPYGLTPFDPIPPGIPFTPVGLGLTPPNPPPPGPGPRPRPRAHPLISPPVPGSGHCRGCYGVPFFMEFCRNGPPVTGQMGMVCPDDPPVSAEISMGGGSAAVNGSTLVYTPGDDDFAFIHVHTKKGDVCFAQASAKNPSDCPHEDCILAHIGYTTTGMAVNETQQLTVVDGNPSTTFSWTVLSGGGSIGAGGLYTAPSSNANCNLNPVIGLVCGGKTIDTLTIAINAVSGTAGYIPYCSTQAAAGLCSGEIKKYDFYCNGNVSPIDVGCGSIFIMPWLPEVPHCTADMWKSLCDQSAATCGGNCPVGCIPYGPTVYKDTRSSEQLAAGCCPPQLL